MAKAETLARTLQATGMLALLRRVGGWNGVLVLGHHRIGDPAGTRLDPAQFSATADGLDAQITVLRRDADLIDPEDLAAALAARRGRHVMLSFDDGYRDNYDVAFPILRRHGVSALFFLATGYLDRPRLPWWDEIAWMTGHEDRGRPGATATRADGGGDGLRAIRLRALAAYVAAPAAEGEALLDALARETGAGRAPPGLGDDLWMTWAMAREMRGAGQHFGAHTHDHPVLTRCDPLRHRHEIRHSIDRVAAELGEPPWAFAYPVGGRDTFDDISRETLRAEGVDLAFSFYGGVERAGRPSDPLDLRRSYVTPQMHPATFRARVALPQLFAREDPTRRRPPPRRAAAAR